MYGHAYSFNGITISSMSSVVNLVIYLDVFPGTQACWELALGFYFSCWLALLMQELWMQKMFLSISLLIPMTILYSQIKIVLLVKLQSKFIVFPCTHALQNFSLLFVMMGLFHCVSASGLLGPNTAAYVVGVLPDLTTIVDGWFALS